jgi:cytochrome P450 monooxygenase
MVTVMAGLRLRLQLSSFIFLHRDKDWFAACKRIHGFLDGYIDEVYKQLQDEKNGNPARYSDGRLRDDFLSAIASQVPGKKSFVCS